MTVTANLLIIMMVTQIIQKKHTTMLKKETTENLPVVGQYSGFWLILVGAALLFGVVLLVKHKQERKK